MKEDFPRYSKSQWILKDENKNDNKNHRGY
jgi:hypothetical protein